MPQAPLSPGQPAGVFIVNLPFTLRSMDKKTHAFQAEVQQILHLVTHSALREEPGVFVHHGVQAQSAQWRQRWEEADVFVFPSALETFGIVLVEALAFQVPVISADVGAAREILEAGAAGRLLPEVTRPALAREIKLVLDEADATRTRVERGWQRARERFDLETNTRRLAEMLHAARGGK